MPFAGVWEGDLFLDRGLGWGLERDLAAGLLLGGRFQDIAAVGLAHGGVVRRALGDVAEEHALGRRLRLELVRGRRRQRRAERRLARSF